MHESLKEAMPCADKAIETPIPKRNYELPLETAIAWRRNWEADLAENQPKNYVRSFRIDRKELEDVMAVPGMSYMRAYFGRAERGGQDKLLLVAVDRDKLDIVSDSGPVFDLNAPCPNTCSPGLGNLWWMMVPARFKPATQPQQLPDEGPRESYEIPMAAAIAWRRVWEADLAENQPKNFVRSFRIDREELEMVMAVPGMAYMRVYFGRAERGGQDKLLLVAVDRNSVDIIGDSGPVYDYGSPCPPICPSNPTANIWW